MIGCSVAKSYLFAILAMSTIAAVVNAEDFLQHARIFFVEFAQEIPEPAPDDGSSRRQGIRRILQALA